MRTDVRMRSSSGFSLVEILVTIAVLTVFLGALAPVMDAGRRSYLTERAVAEALDDARFAIERIAELLRSAGYNPRRIRPLTPVTVGAAGTSLRLRSDLNGDGDLLDSPFGPGGIASLPAPEDVTLSLAGTTVMMQDNTPAGGGLIPLAEDVTSLGFEALPGKVVRVTVAVRPFVEPGVPLGRPVAVVQDVARRN